MLFACSTNECIKSVNFYFDGDFAVKAVKNGENYILEQFDKKLFADELFSNMSLKNGNEFSDFSETVMLQKELCRIKKDLQPFEKSDAVDKLNIKLGETIASQIVSALEEKENFYSVAVIDTESSASNFNSIMVIDTNMGALLLKPCVVGLENAVTITACTRNEIKMLVKSIVCRAVE